MASDSDASCEEDPNFAVICAFIEKFGELVGITDIDFCELQSMLENTHEVSQHLVELHVKLLRKIKKVVSQEKWEKSIIKFCHTFSNIDAWEFERFGYKNAKLSSKIRLLKELLEAQFDLNSKFKVEINKITSKELRSQPLGRDRYGHAYWFQSDFNCQIRVYKEDLDDEKWTLVAKDRNGLLGLISTLNDSDIKVSSDSAGNEDSNSLSEKPIVDTGQQDTDSKKTSEDEDSNITKDNHKEAEEPELETTHSSDVLPSSKEQIDQDKHPKDVIQKFKIKGLEVVIAKDSVVGETVEEPIMHVEGEGSGADNESVIVGDVIEETVMYFRGEGNGYDCEAANQPDNADNSKAKSSVDENESQTDRQSVAKVCDSGTAGLDLKTDNSSQSGEKESDHRLEDNSLTKNGEALEDCNSLVDSEIGKPKKPDNQLEDEKVEDMDKSSKSNLTNQSDDKVENHQNTLGLKTDSDTKQVEEHEILQSETTELASNEAPNDSKNATVPSPENRSHSPVEPKIPVVEPPCIKKSSYVCGNDEDSKENKERSQEDGSEKPLKDDVRSKETSTEVDVEQQDTIGSASIDDAPSSEVKISNEKSHEKSGKTSNAKIQKPTEKVLEPRRKSLRNKVLLKTKDEVAEPKNEDETKCKSKVSSAESSITNSPNQSMGDSVISTSEVTAAESAIEANSLGVPNNEGSTTKVESTAPSVQPVETVTSSVSSDLKNTVPHKPSPMRAVRKRGLETISTHPQPSDDGSGKKMKLKNRRQVDTALRKSVEQRIEQLHGSSSESKASDDDQSKCKKPARFGKKKSPKKDEETLDTPNKKKSKKETGKYSRILAGLDADSSLPQLRQSRRIAQLKIREQAANKLTNSEGKDSDEGKKKKDRRDEYDKPEKRKREKGKDVESESEEKSLGRKKKKRKEKPASQIFNEKRPWQSSSEDSEDGQEEEEDEEIIEEEEDLGPLKSDHEFSPESEEDNDEEWQPVRRARTAKKESDAEQIDDLPCQKCDKNDHPEWILLCDKCDNGWHCSCLRPPLLGIPEGDWFCPPCEHVILLERLQEKLVEYDKKISKKEIEDRRKERLAYVGISLNNVLPSKEKQDHRTKKKRRASSSESASESERSETESDSDEPIYQLRQRRQARSYKFNEYDEMIKDAIGEENKPEDTAGNLGRGKDIQTIVKGLEPEAKAKEKEDVDDDRPTAANLKKMLRKKHRKLNSLDFDSEEEDISDEDFKGSTEESEEEEEEMSDPSEDSDDFAMRRRRKNMSVRRSTRARIRRFDEDFINDDSDDDAPKRKKKRSIWDESDTPESDMSIYSDKKPKKKKRHGGSKSSGGMKNNRSRIKYGGLTSSDEDLVTGRRTRGKKATYVDTLGSDSDEFVERKTARKIKSDDDEDFIANEEEEAEEDDKESEEKDQVEDEDDSEEEIPVKPPLIVPKIYIKKPLGAKKTPVPVQANLSVPENKGSLIPANTPEKLSQIITKDVPSIKQGNFIGASQYPESKKEQLKLSNIVAEDRSSNPINAARALLGAHIKITSVKVKNENNSGESLVGNSESTQRHEEFKGIATKARKSSVMHEPIVSNVSALIRNDVDNEDLSEPPGIALPLFDEVSDPSKMKNSFGGSAKLYRTRGPGRRKITETKSQSQSSPVKPSQPAIEIAAPPQPFSQEQPTPSVITRMLQSKPSLSIYPIGSIRPKQFATMRDDDSDDSSPKASPTSLSSRPPGDGGPANQYNPRGTPPMIYGHQGTRVSGSSHFPKGSEAVRGAPLHSYGHQPSRTMDPSPSGGGPINIMDSTSGPSKVPLDNSRDFIPRCPPTDQSLTSKYPITGPRPMRMHQQPIRPPPHPAPSNGNIPVPHPYISPSSAPSSGPPGVPHPAYPIPSSPLGNGSHPPPQPYPMLPSDGSKQHYPPPSSAAPSEPQSPPRVQYHPPPTPQDTPTSQPSDDYYENYPPPPSGEDALPLPYDGLQQEPGSPLRESYNNESNAATNPPPDSNKAYDEESGGEFAGLASYFSSQREDDLES